MVFDMMFEKINPCFYLLQNYALIRGSEKPNTT
jgi:hypothetical protein